MLDTDTKRRIDTARDILVGKVPDPKSQVEQITIALIYKFMDDMDAEAEEFGGKRKFFTGEFAGYGWAKLMAEMTLQAYYRDWGLKSASCRYFTVYGERGHENHAVIAMIASARR